MDGLDDLERRLARRLQPDRAPGADETWRRIAPRLETRADRGRLRLLPGWAAWTAGAVVLVVALFAALALRPPPGGNPAAGTFPTPMGAPTSTVPHTNANVRTTPTIVVGILPPTSTTRAAGGGIAWNGNLITELQPWPPFTVFQPSTLPAGMQLVANAYNPGADEGGHPRGAPSVSGASSRGGGRDADPGVIQAARQRAGQLLGDERKATLVLIYAAGPHAFVELVQRSARGASLPTGEAITVRALPAVSTQRDGRDGLTWIEGDTLLSLYTTLGQSEALRVAAGLRPTIVLGLTTPTGARTPTPPAWVGAPLAQRRGAVTVPQVDRQAVARQCGEWHPNLYAQAPQPVYQQLICMARFIAGADERGNAGVSRYTWHEAAERLGLDLAAGPAGDPGVWLVSVDVSERGGQVVVLDADTGEPYLLVELLPLP